MNLQVILVMQSPLNLMPSVLAPMKVGLHAAIDTVDYGYYMEVDLDFNSNRKLKNFLRSSFVIVKSVGSV